MAKLIASSETYEGIIKLTAEYFCVPIEQIAIQGNSVVKNGKIFHHLKIARKAKRYRLELIDIQ